METPEIIQEEQEIKSPSKEHPMLEKLWRHWENFWGALACTAFIVGYGIAGVAISGGINRINYEVLEVADTLLEISLVSGAIYLGSRAARWGVSVLFDTLVQTQRSSDFYDRIQ